jgi:hypothetical protein
MLLLTEDAVIVCKHELGHVSIEPTQNLVTIAGRRLLVEPDTERRGISRCPNYGISIKPCTLTLAVRQGYSNLLRIQGKRVGLDTIKGLTDGTPPGIVEYKVRSAGQQFVFEGSDESTQQ